MRLVNYNSAVDARRGCFSLVFYAKDRASGQSVALKFYDPQAAMDRYRLESFHREHGILDSLLGVDRCLQLASGLQSFQLLVATAAGPTIPLPCEYFAVEWVEDDIDRFFFCQEKYEASEKLKLFASIAASVGVLHSKGVFHRDLKPDNLRLSRAQGRPQVIPIDLGTAARFASAPLQQPYYHTAGAPAYSSPEARCGLAGNRLLARYTDLYALGCMLFELFNKDLFFHALLTRNSNYHVILAALHGSLDLTADENTQKQQWEATIGRFGASFVPVPINGPGSEIPRGIAPMVNEVVLSLTHPDYRRRPSIAWVCRRIESTLTILRNEKIYRKRLEQIRTERQRRIEKIRIREARIEEALAKYLK